MLQGFMELVERDATAIWWYNRLNRPGVDLASFGLGYLTELAAHYDSLERDLWALDLTHDLGIPAGHTHVQLIESMNVISIFR